MSAICTINGCDKPVLVKMRGWCRMHYTRWYRWGDPLGAAPPRPKKICSVAGCDSATKCKGMCQKHYDAHLYAIKKTDAQWKEAQAERLKEQYRKHREKRLEWMRNYYSDNREYFKSKSAKYRSKQDKSKVNAARRNRYHADVAVSREKSRLKTQRRRSKARNLPTFTILDKDLRRIYSSPCAYCGSTELITLDHVIPMERGGSFGIGNITAACESCNKSKRDRLPIEYRVWKMNRNAA